MKDKIEKFIVLFLVLSVVLATDAANAELAHWKFDGNANDSSGNSNNGTETGSPVYVPGRIGNLALSFDGIDDYVNCGSSLAFDVISNAVTISCWIKVDSFDKEWQAIVTKGENSWRLSRRAETNSLHFAASGLTPQHWLDGNINVNDGQWHHVAGVYDGAKLYLYIDTVMDVSIDAIGTINANNSNIYIGENEGFPGRCFNGSIDDVRIYNRALSKEEIIQLYVQDLSPTLQLLTCSVQEAREIFKEQGPKEAIVFLKNKIAEYEQLKQKNPDDITLPARLLFSDLYLLLAKAKEAASMPGNDVIEAYKKAASQPLRRLDYVPVFLWLFEKLPANEYIDAVRKCVFNGDVTPTDIRYITENFEESKNFSAFTLFISVFSEANSPAPYYKAVAEGLKQDGTWADKFWEYCSQLKPQLTKCVLEAGQILAEKNMQHEKFSRAIEIYRDILNRCGNDQDKVIWELKICECVFYSGQYAPAIDQLDSFIKKNKTANRTLTEQAIMLKGQAHSHLGDIDQAINTFSGLLIEYPQSEHAPEASFFIGYYYMLQGKFDQATQALNLVVQTYPESSFANKAGMCLTRIKNMTE